MREDLPYPYGAPPRRPIGVISGTQGKVSDPLGTFVAMTTNAGAPHRPGIDARQLERIRALLAKAESTPFEHEADSYTAKAQELMARHSIDAAMVDRSRPAGSVGAERRDVLIHDPYASPKSILISAIARANHAEAVWSPSSRTASLIGFPVDLEMVELLYTSLLVQATRAMTAAGSQVDGSGRSRTRSFRSSFLLSFASRIGERLAEATRQATSEAVHEHGAALLPVLADRDAEVLEARDQAFPRLSTYSARPRHRGGWLAGRIAADAVDLHGQRLTPGSGRLTSGGEG